MPKIVCEDCKCANYPDCTLPVDEDEDTGVEDSCDCCVDGVSGCHLKLDQYGVGLRGSLDGYEECESCGAWIPANDREHKEECKLEKQIGRIAIILNTDHNMQFLDFQREYLNNAFHKLLFREGFVKTLQQFVNKPGSLLVKGDPDYASDQDGEPMILDPTKEDLPTYSLDHVSNQLLGGNLTQEEMPQKARLDELINFLRVQSVPIPENYYHLPLESVEEYKSQWEKVIPVLCDHLPRILKQEHMRTFGKDKSAFGYKSEEYDILLYARTASFILIRGCVGDKEVIFAHGESNFPAIIQECMLGEAREDDLKDWRSSRTGIIPVSFYKSEDPKEERTTKRRKILTQENPPNYKIGQKVLREKDLCKLLDLKELPQEFKQAIEKGKPKSQG